MLNIVDGFMRTIVSVNTLIVMDEFTEAHFILKFIVALVSIFWIFDAMFERSKYNFKMWLNQFKKK